MSSQPPGSQPPSAPPQLPKLALDRLHRGQGDFFTSDLSVDEYLLIKAAGFHPRGLVVGSSIYHIGAQIGNYNQNQELGYLSQAMYEARSLAMARMEAEADALGADGVAGVRLTFKAYEWGPGLAEFMAIGTAIKSESGGSYKTPAGKPFTSDLSGQDFWKLIKAGHAPLGLVMGTCVYHVAHQGFRQALSQLGRNAEMPNYTQAIYEAREIAMDRMQYEAMQLQAEGVVGVRVEEVQYYWGSHVIEYFSVGTAVRRLDKESPIPEPQLTLPVNT
ncbi:MAG: heavy metal-binding domain-containing protein [Candidatus Dormibacteraceae bacterium]